MNYGFLIRNDRCIGCHACSTACKSENQVPLGVNRTWVKNVETGAYPDVRRHFQVTRCNHCANPPCARICPVTAMYQRTDGIVEFDPDVCIGCKACLQACPYDAIYVDPDTGTAAKCHYCAHRVELDLEPACVVVCPEHAIIAGDIDDPSSEISRMLAEHQVTVRKPEQGTAPKLFYAGGDDTALHPTATDRTPPTFAWADVLPLHDEAPAASAGDGVRDAPPLPDPGGNGFGGGAPVPSKPHGAAHRTSASGAALRAPQVQGVPAAGPITIGEGRMAGQMVQVFYNAQHHVPWHWPVPAYLVTKSMGTGIFMVLALGFGLGLLPFAAVPFVVAGFLALLFTGLTTALLVYDLERPERFLRILTRPQWGSWLTRGAFLLVAFSLLAGLWWLFEVAAWLGALPEGPVAAVRAPLLWLGLPFAAGAAVYTAYLFGQAEGRDLWQSALLPLHLLVQAFAAGSATLLVADVFLAAPGAFSTVASATFGVSLGVDLLVTLAGEFAMPHASDAAARAAHEIRSGRYAPAFWWGSIVVGHLVPLALLVIGVPLLAALAGLLALAGLYAYEYVFVMAPQEIPNS